MQDGDMEAAEKLVLHNLKFCLSYVRTFCGKGVPMDDLVAAAYTGMIKASRKFKPGHGKFISYAVWEMRSHMQRCLSTQSHVVSYPQNAVSRQAPVIRFFEKHNSEGGGTLYDHNEVAEGAGITATDSAAVMGLFRRHVSLSMSPKEASTAAHNYGYKDTTRAIGGAMSSRRPRKNSLAAEDRDDPPIDNLVDEKTPPPDACAEDEDRKRIVELLLKETTKRQRIVLEEVFMNDKPLYVVGAELGVSHQCVACTRDRGLANARRVYNRLKARGVL